MPGTINSQNLASPLSPRQLPAGLLISSLQFSDDAQVHRLQKVAGGRGKPDHTNTVLRVQSHECLSIVRRTVVHQQKYGKSRIVHHILEVLTIWREDFANVDFHGIANLVPFRRLLESKIIC
jgi:hypothetical protein